MKNTTAHAAGSDFERVRRMVLMREWCSEWLKRRSERIKREKTFVFVFMFVGLVVCER